MSYITSVWSPWCIWYMWSLIACEFGSLWIFHVCTASRVANSELPNFSISGHSLGKVEFMEKRKFSRGGMPQSPAPRLKAAIFSIRTDLCNLDISCHSGRTSDSSCWLITVTVKKKEPSSGTSMKNSCTALFTWNSNHAYNRELQGITAPEIISPQAPSLCECVA